MAVLRPDPSPSSADVVTEWSYTSSPLICLNGVGLDNFTFFMYLRSSGFSATLYTAFET